MKSLFLLGLVNCDHRLRTAHAVVADVDLLVSFCQRYEDGSCSRESLDDFVNGRNFNAQQRACFSLGACLDKPCATAARAYLEQPSASISHILQLNCPLEFENAHKIEQVKLELDSFKRSANEGINNLHNFIISNM